jgi:hypothetical protein
MVYGWEDWDFWLSLLRLNLKVYKIPKVYFFYRLKEVSMAKSMNEEQHFFMRLHAYLNHWDLYRHMVDIRIRFRVAELYLDTGMGFTPHQVLRKIIFTDQREIDFDLSGYRGIRQCRFDPINTPATIHIKEIRVTGDDGTSYQVEDFQSNALYRKDSNLIFATADPQILFPVGAVERPSQLTVRLAYNAVGEEAFQEILECQNGMLAETRAELGMKNAELERINTLLAQKERTIEEIFLSRSWRVTKPLRRLTELFRDGEKRNQ